MNNRTLQLLIFLSIAAVMFLLAVNFLPHFTSGSTSGVRINFQEVKGASVVYKGKTYTLNGEQQALLVTSLNSAIPIGRNEFNADNAPDVGQFEIYFFKKDSPLVLKPIGLIGKNLVFRVPEWNRDGWIKDVTDGGLLQLLKDSHPDDQPNKNP
jgi:hypothetical protein